MRRNSHAAAVSKKNDMQPRSESEAVLDTEIVQPACTGLRCLAGSFRHEEDAVSRNCESALQRQDFGDVFGRVVLSDHELEDDAYGVGTRQTCPVSQGCGDELLAGIRSFGRHVPVKTAVVLRKKTLDLLMRDAGSVGFHLKGVLVWQTDRNLVDGLQRGLTTGEDYVRGGGAGFDDFDELIGIATLQGLALKIGIPGVARVAPAALQVAAVQSHQKCRLTDVRTFSLQARVQLVDDESFHVLMAPFCKPSEAWTSTAGKPFSTAQLLR